MKKLLLGTTGLVAAAAVFVSAANAQTPKVTIGGFANFEAGTVHEDLDSGKRSQGFRNDTELSFRVDGKMENRDLGYGAVADLEADVSPDVNNQGFNAARTYVYLDGMWGRFELGSNEGASSTMRVDASTLAAASGGIDGSWVFFASPTGQSFITTPGLPTEHGSLTALNDEGQANANKITYYSPRYQGFQAGVGYQPSQTDRGQQMTRVNNVSGQSGNIFDAGLNYENQFGDVSLAAAATGQMGNANSVAPLQFQTQDLQAYNVGALVGYMGFKLAGSYGDWSDSNAANGSKARYWTVGAGYDYGAFGSSVTYLNSKTQGAGRFARDNKFDNIVVSVDYKLAPGLTPYAEYSMFNFDAAGNVRGQNNNGQVFLVGTQLAF